MHVVGLDLSLTATGIAHVYSGSVVLDTVTSKGHADATLTDRRGRLHGLTNILVSHTRHADLVVIEGPAFSRSNPGMHDRSGLWWLVIDRLVGVVPVAVVAPTGRAKYATGKGNASKDAVLAAVVRRYLTVDVGNNNEADALILAAMGARNLGHQLEESLPIAHLAAMDGVQWPDDAARSVPGLSRAGGVVSR